MALLLAREVARRQLTEASLAGLVLIAPAPDFTEQLMWNGFTPEIREEIQTKGVWMRPSQYGDGAPYPITRALIEEGRNHLLLGSAIDVGCPVRILQGAQDPDVPWQHAFALAHRLPTEDVVLTMIQDGDHRLSRPQDIARIISAKADDPVRRGFSVRSLTALEYWMPAFAGMTTMGREKCHGHIRDAARVLRCRRSAQRQGVCRIVHGGRRLSRRVLRRVRRPR
jgi:hypothetical protein